MDDNALNNLPVEMQHEILVNEFKKKKNIVLFSSH